MKQILVNGKLQKVVIEDVPAPMLKDNGVLIQVQYSLISTGTELASFRQPRSSYFRRAATKRDFARKAINFVKKEGIKETLKAVRGENDFSPTGYSGAGVVIDVGKNVADLGIGDRVAYARARHAEIVFSPRNYVVKLPGNVDFREGAFVTLGSIAMQAVRRAKVELGETILVVGLGLVGQLVNQLLQASGCHVIGSDLSEKRIDIAKAFGLEKGIVAGRGNLVKEVLDYTDQIGVDAVIICAQSASSEIINQAMEVCRERGRVIVVGAVGLNLERRPFYTNELDLMISRAYGPGCYDPKYVEKGIDYPLGYVRWTANRNMKEFAKLVSKGQINVKKLISGEFEIENAQSAYEALLSDKASVLSVLLRYKPSEVIQPISRTIMVSKRITSKYKGQINVAVIGAGGISKGYHLPHLKRINNVNIYAIVSGTGVNARKVAEEYGARYCTTNYKEVLNDKMVDCVLVATRHNLHKEMVVESAKAGKNIYVEKPMAMDYEGVKEIVKTIKDTEVIMTVGTNRRYSLLSHIAKEIIKGKNGPALINYRVNTTTLPLGHWVNDPVEGGGRVIGEAPHFFDLLYWLLEAEPVRVYAERVDSKKENLLKENNIVSTIKFADGSIGSLSYSDFGSSKFPKERIEIFIEGTVIEITDFQEIKVSDGTYKKLRQRDTGLYEQMRNFIEVLQGKRQLDLGVEDGARSTICALKVLDSLKEEKPVDINLAEYL